MRLPIRHIAIILLSLLWSCNGEAPEPPGTYNQLEVSGAVLPVHMHGPSDSRTAVVVVGGGPGGSAILERSAVGLYRLEEKFRMVYFDQRGSGIGSGNTDPASLSVEQMAGDLHGVIALTEAIPGVENIFLISLDWGAAVATEYLTSSERSPLIRGYVAVSPGWNAVRAFDRSQAELADLGQQFLDDGAQTNDIAAQNLLDFLDANDEINIFNYDRYVQLLDALNGIVFLPDPPVSGAVLPQYVQASVDHNERFVLENWTFRDLPFLQSLNLDAEMARLDLPVKLIWGAWDRQFPVSLAQEYQAALSAASDNESVSVFPLSAHQPHREEGDRFYATVATWIGFWD